MTDVETGGVRRGKLSARKLSMIGMLAAVSTVLAFIDFSLPFFPPFLKFDLSDLPVLLSAFMFGPVSGVFVTLVKNVIGLFSTSTAGVGELSNFLISAALSLGAGLVYRGHKSKRQALIGTVAGVLAMVVVSGFSNYFLVIPAYSKVMPIDAIVAMCHEINPSINGILGYVILAAMPFTLLKGAVCGGITFLVYKKLHGAVQKFVR